MPIPHPKPIPGPVTASFLQGWGQTLSFARDPLTFLRQLHHRYGEIATFTQDHKQHIFVFSSAYNQQVLGNSEVFQVVELPFPVPANSAMSRLFTIPGQMNGPKNGQQRHVMLTALHKRHFAHYGTRLQTLVQKRLAVWQVGETRDILAEMTAVTMATPAYAMFEIDVETDNGRSLVALLSEWGDMLLANSTRFMPYNLPGTTYRRLRQLSEELEQAYRDLIAQKRAQGLEGDDPLTTLLKIHDHSPNRLNDAELIGQINNLLNAGNTSRATILTWTLFLLAYHPAVLAGIQTELSTVLNGRWPLPSDLPQLPLLHHALKESMRLLPPMNWFTRRAVADSYLGPYFVPAGSRVMVSPLITHRQYDIYEEPYQFKPERWQTLKTGPYDYLPFGAGSRMCTGSEFATMELSLILAMILQRYQLVLPPNVQVERNGLMMCAPKQLPMVVQAPGDLFDIYPYHGNLRDWVQLPNAG